MSMQWDKMRFSNSQANLLPDHHPVNLEYHSFLKQFGEEGNVVVLAVKDSSLFTPEKFNRWNKLSKQLGAFPEVDFVLSTDNLQELDKGHCKARICYAAFYKTNPKNQKGGRQFNQSSF